MVFFFDKDKAVTVVRSLWCIAYQNKQNVMIVDPIVLIIAQYIIAAAKISIKLAEASLMCYGSEIQDQQFVLHCYCDHPGS